MRKKRAHVLQLLSVVDLVTILRDGEKRLKGVLLTWITIIQGVLTGFCFALRRGMILS